MKNSPLEDSQHARPLPEETVVRLHVLGLIFHCHHVTGSSCLRPTTLTCVASHLPCTFVHTFQLSHTVLEGLHTALHAVCFLPILPEGADLLVEFFQFLCLAVYYSLPDQRG